MNTAEPAPLPPVVDPLTFRTLAAEKDTRVIDVRWALDGSKGEHTYRAGHLPGAVYVDLATQLAAPADPEHGRHPLPTPEQFAHAMRAAGIGDGTTVLVYDDTDGSQASRLVWMLRALGERAAVLDGGLTVYLAATGEQVVTEVPEVPPAAFTIRDWAPDAIASADEVQQALADGTAAVVDARAPERYRGESEPIDPRAGHVPGALNLPFAGNVAEDGTFLDAEALRRRFTDAGLDPADEVIVYCGSGITATHDLLALQRAGFENLRLFPGSWSQWSADPEREVATGARP